MLYRNMYWFFLYFSHALCFTLVYNCGLTVRNKRICNVMLQGAQWRGCGVNNLPMIVRQPEPTGSQTPDTPNRKSDAPPVASPFTNIIGSPRIIAGRRLQGAWQRGFIIGRLVGCLAGPRVPSEMDIATGRQRFSSFHFSTTTTTTAIPPPVNAHHFI